MRGETRQLDDGPITAKLLLEETPHAQCYWGNCECNPVRGEFWHIVDGKPYCPVHARIAIMTKKTKRE